MNLIKKLVDRINEKHSSTASFYSFDPIGHSRFYLSALEWVLNEIEKLNKESEASNSWISVDDALPPNDGSFWLVFTETGRISECRYYSDEWITTYCNNETVTHWQPLPQPPKER